MPVGGQTVGRIGLDLGLNYNGFQKQMNGISKTATGMAGGAFKKLAIVAAAAFSVRQISKFASSTLSLASDLAEVQNVVDVSFKEMASSVSNFAETEAEMFGLSEFMAKKFTGTMGAMTKSMGFSTNEAASMSIELAKLSGDFASFYNLDPEEAFHKIRLGIAGQTEGLQALGISLTQAAVEQYMLTQGVKESFQALSVQEKALWRYNTLMGVSADAQGDFARTSEGWANQVRIMSLRWDTFKAGIGEGLMELFLPVLRTLNTVLTYLIRFAKTFSMIMKSIFGVKQAEVSVAKAAASIASETDAAAAAQDNLADSTAAAGKAAKNSLASFDKLNIVGQDADAGAGGGGGEGFDVPSLFDDVGTDSASALDEAQTNMNKFVDGLRDKFAVAGNIFKKFYENELKPVFGQFSTFFSETVWPGITSSFNVFKTSFTPVFGKYFKLYASIASDVWKSFKESLPDLLAEAEETFKSLNTLWQEAMAVIGEITGEALDTLRRLWFKWGKDTWDNIWKTVLGIWDTFNQFLNEWVIPIFREGLDWLKRMWDENLRDIVMAIGEFVAKAANFLLDLWNNVLKPIIDWLIKYLGPMVKATFTNIMGVLEVVFKFIKGFVQSVLKIFGGLIEFLTGVFTGDWKRAWNGIKQMLSGVKDFIMNFVNTAINTIRLFATSIGRYIKAAVGQIKTIFEPLIKWFGGLWKLIQDVFAGVGDWFSGIFTGAKDAIVRVFDQLANAIKKPINAMIDNINALISKLNGLNIRLPKILGGETLGFNIPRIPKLAEGGIVSQPTLAMVGDNRRSPEVVAPLHELTNMLKTANKQSQEEMISLLRSILTVLKTLELDTQVYIGNEQLESYIEKRKARKIMKSGKMVTA